MSDGASATRLPTGWRIAKVAEVAEQVRGVTYAKADASSEARDGYLPILRAGNITDFGLTMDDLIYVPEAKVSRKQQLIAGDVMIAASSGSLQVVGKAAQVEVDLGAGFGAFCKVLRPKSNVEPRFFGHYFRTSDYRRTVSRLASGANINNLRGGHLDDLAIPLPPLAEQRRIASVLDHADALRAKRRHTLHLLDTLTQSIFNDMFGGQAYEVSQLKEIVRAGTSVTYGIVQAGEECPGGVPYIRTGDIVDGRINVATLRRTSSEIAVRFPRSRIEAGDIVMSIRATVGTTAMVTDELTGANLTQGTARIAPGPRVHGTFLIEYLRSLGAQRWIQRQVKGATFREITLGRLRELPVSLPALDLQRAFSERIMGVDAARCDVESSVVELDMLQLGLQHRAFRGEL